jgi:hypothetical protein
MQGRPSVQENILELDGRLRGSLTEECIYVIVCFASGNCVFITKTVYGVSGIFYGCKLQPEGDQKN